MQRWARVLAAIGAGSVAVGVLSVGAASAQTGDCYLDDAGRLTCHISAPPVAPRTETFSPDSTLIWRSEPAIGPCPGRSTTDPVTGTVTIEAGVYWWIQVIDRASGTVVSDYFTCLYASDPAPAPPPAPPTPAEFSLAAADALLPTTELSPRAEFDGVTGIDTWFWCDQPEAVTVGPLSLRGWTISATVSVSKVTWNVSSDVAEGFTLTSDDCGAEPDIGSDGSAAAEIWTPRTKGAYDIEILSEWTGTWTLSYGAINTGPQALGPVEIAGDDVQYRVIEVIALGTD